MHLSKLLSCALIICVVAVAHGEAPAASAPAVTNQEDAVVARVGTSVVKRRELDMAMHGIRMQMAQQGREIPAERLARFEHDVLDEIIGRELLLQDCQGKESAAVGEQFKQQLEETYAQVGGEEALKKALGQTGVTVEEYKRRLRENILIQSALESLVEQKVKVSAAEAREFYDANANRFKRPEMVRASHILIQVPKGANEETKAAKRTQIEAARALVKGGEKFADVAKKVSECPSGKQGGDLGSFARGQMVPEFELAAFSLKTNELSEVVTTSFGYHVLLVTEHKDAEQQPFEKMQPDIEKMLKNRKGSAVARDHVKELRDKATVEILLAPLPAETNAPAANPPAPKS